MNAFLFSMLRTIWLKAIKVEYQSMLIREVQQHHFEHIFIIIYLWRIAIDPVYMLRDDNRHHIKKSPYSKTISHKIMEPMRMLSHFVKLYPILATIMYTAIVVDESSKFLVLIKSDYRSIKPLHIMVSMSK